ncbi:MAG TPA: gluconate 2-dehydrogenase subunit 3 family protein [Bryobacteraceae bacterium]|nr:gluconate 2-dehydrogenase subunit 3 family protein [Bryobacteraceae bacterium]
MTDRREFLQLAIRAAVASGATELLPILLKASESGHSMAVQIAPPAPAFVDSAPRFFDAKQFSALQAFTEVLIPTDDTPGAREAHCAHFIDFLLASADEVPSLQKTWRDAMQTLEELGFLNADRQRQEAMIGEMSRPERDATAHHQGFPVYLLIKRENTFAYYTSRPGLIENLDYRGDSYNEVFPACTHPEHQHV